ncbi:hypothetical protein CYY_001180 [Polysphondylium violaceum]|uniref:Sm domain-containing protein n=1 Tax=Polysphondylium violaceum TaxID=133409 RepID=A0A8J4Q0G6_9MYCE|nr:hypothetical protein CYY_001180 [Polysphondylium violaceum]
MNDNNNSNNSIGVGKTFSSSNTRQPKEFKTLLCVFSALKGTQITIQLRSDTEFYGTIENVDKHLNIELSDARSTNKFNQIIEYQLILVQSRNIRYIHIPDRIDLNNLLFIYSKTLSDIKKKNQRTKRKPGTLPYKADDNDSDNDNDEDIQKEEEE